jgi:hypothetical protein
MPGLIQVACIDVCGRAVYLRATLVPDIGKMWSLLILIGWPNDKSVFQVQNLIADLHISPGLVHGWVLVNPLT